MGNTDSDTDSKGATGMSTKSQHSAGRGVATVDRETGSVTRRTAASTPGGGSGPHLATEPSGDDRAVDARETRKAGRRAAASNTDGTGEAAGGWRRAPLLGTRWGRRALSVVAALGIAGTIGFGHAWANQRSTLSRETAARNTAQDFLLALTNFTSKNVDAQFNEVQSFATGPFESQSNQFFGSSIRQQLEAALASSRGQIRNLYVQSVSGSAASVYGVVDQTYVNNKMSSPAADVLRVVVDLTDTSSGWKISAVTVLNDPSSSTAPASGASSSTAPASGAPSSTAG